MSDEESQEVRSVTAAQAKAGVRAPAGRPLVLILRDIHGAPSPSGGAGRPASGRSPSKPSALAKSAPQLREARWAQPNLHQGDEAVAEATVEGGEGRSVNFVIERGSGGQWSEHLRVSGQVSGGKARVTLPAPDGDDDLELRFHCEIA